MALVTMAKVTNPFKSRRWRGPSPLFIVVGIFLVVWSVVPIPKFAIVETRGMDIPETLAPVSFVSGGIRVHREQIDGTDVLWASPDDNGRGKVQGLLFLAHGCGHSNRDWFSKVSPECEDCRGLPEEVSIVQAALDMGLVAVATSSSNWRSKCWSGFDVTPVALVLNELWHRFSEDNKAVNSTTTSILGKERLPVYAFGASSGGAFVSSLAGPLQSRFGIRLNGFISQIAAEPTNPKQDLQEPNDLCKVYITMNKDTNVDNAAKNRVKECQSSKHKHRCQHIRLPPLEIKPKYFSERIEQIVDKESYDIVKVLTRGGFISPDKGELYRDPRLTHKDWSRALKKESSAKNSNLDFASRGDALISNQSPIFEVLNVAWGQHELSRDGVKEALEFCLQQEPTKPK